jgi:hypothetical protein
MQAVVGKLDIDGQSLSRVASVRFGRGAVENFNFPDYDTKEEIQQAIGNIPYPPYQSTDTPAGLNLSRTEVCCTCHIHVLVNSAEIRVKCRGIRF